LENTDIPKLFTEFQQLDASLNKKYQGTGLGLALTKRIAEAQNGQVGVTSTVGKGSIFYIILPRVQHELDQNNLLSLASNPISVPISKSTPANLAKNKVALASTKKKTGSFEALKESPQKKSSKTILVIDDDPIDSALIFKTLATAGYTIETAYTGANAIKLCREKQFDLITLDLLLPDMNGWDVLRGLRSMGANLDTPCIVLTVIGSKASSFGFMIQNFLVKPIKSEDLILALQQSGIYENQNKSILFVDDDTKILTLCKNYLKDYGATVYCESDPERGLILANEKKPDVIILDLLMPGLDGLEFLQRFRKTEYGKKTPVIICTSQDVTDVDRSRIKASVEYVIQKGDGSMKELLSEVHRVCPLQRTDKTKGSK
jgi:CheY-like chemotaxis protein